MALVQFKNSEAIEISKKMAAPKKVEHMQQWFRAARKVIPEIPNPEQTDWQITNEYADNNAKFISFEMHNTVGGKCVVTIDRKVPFIG